MSPAQVTRVRRYSSASQSKRWGSFGVSLFLHLGILFSIVFVARQEPVKLNLDAPIMTLTQVTIGAPGPKPTAPPPSKEKPAPPAPPAPPAKPVEAEAVPVPKIEEVAKQAEPVAPPPPPVVEKKVEEPPKPVEPVKKGPTDEELLAAALAGAKSEAKAAPKVSGGQSILDAALSSAGTDAKAEKVVTGESGDGYGVVGLYHDSIISRVRPHFTIRPHTDGSVYVVIMRIEIGVDGSLLRVSVKEPSGDPLLDANVTRAIREAGRFEAPPKGQQVWEIPFTSDIYGGQ